MKGGISRNKRRRIGFFMLWFAGNSQADYSYQNHC
jgi:hypothetical protein